MRNAASLAPQELAHLDATRLRADFPLLARKMNGRVLSYLDSAATSQKPRSVIDAMARFYEESNANVHRGVYALSQQATAVYEGARVLAGRFLNASDPREIIFVRGATEAINLVAWSYGRTHLGPGDEVLLTRMEHHSNIVPWQRLCQEQGARLRVVPMDQRGELDLDEYERLLSARTRLVAVAHVSNALGTVNPVKKMIELAHAREIPVLVDGAQAAPHLRVDVRDLDADFYAVSSHKMFGPSGMGLLYGKAALLEAMPPYQSGGDMILSVSFDETSYAPLPHKFEAGTPNMAGAAGLAAAIDYLESIDFEAALAYEDELLHYATRELATLPEVRLIGTAAQKKGVLSFTVDGVHPHDVGTILDQEGVAVRVGHHCAQPVMEHFGVPATVRASLAFYNNYEDMDRLVAGVRKVIEVFS